MTELPLSSPPIIQTLLIAIPSVTPEPQFSMEIETGLGGTEADSTRRSVSNSKCLRVSIENSQVVLQELKTKSSLASLQS